ncbi:DUF2931 family protein [Epilithonimonas sp. FP105]|nr:DUF2931 family protein [Epilithonimonas sp. FP105]
MTEAEKAAVQQEIYDRPSEIWPTNKNSNGEYYYTTSLCSFPGYISENAGSHFVTGSESVGFLTMENGVWPQTTSSALNDEYHPLPKKLYVAYFSAAEDKFYEGLFDLPYDRIKEELDKIWRAYPNRSLYTKDKYDRYQELIVGVAPQGDVVVWLSSSSQQLVIGTYKAKETTAITWEDFKSANNMGDVTREHYVKTITKSKYPIPIGKIEKYGKQYHWKPKIEYEDKRTPEKIETLKYYIKDFNGGYENIYALYEKENVFKLRNIPKTVIFEFNIGTLNYGGGFDLQEDDVFKAYSELGSEDKTQLEMVVILDKTNKISRIILRNDLHEYVLDCKDVQLGVGEIETEITPLTETD